MKRPRRSALHTCTIVSILIAVCSCGGGGGGGESSEQPAMASTLAYVVTECRGDLEAWTIHQSLQIRQGEQAPVTVVEHSAVVSGAVFPLSICDYIGRYRQATLFDTIGVFHRLGVTPDGSQVVFEVTDEVTGSIFADFRLVFPPNALPAEQKGIFAVRADGTGVRRLGPASRNHAFFESLFAFSPNGRTIAYIDRGPSRDNRDATQIFTLDLVTGERTQVTQLPQARTYTPFFNDDQTITFFTRANADGNHPGGATIAVSVKSDGTGLTVAPPVVALPGSELLTSFRITGAELDTAVLIVSGKPKNGEVNGNPNISEVFDIDRDNNILQLTDFERSDTYAPTVSADAQRVFFSASADPLGTNPWEDCQMFSIDRAGGDLRQLTHFHEGPEGQRSGGCIIAPPPLGCGLFFTSRDIRSDAIVFLSLCDLVGANPYGMQAFAMHSDGTGLNQLTNTHGYTVDASGVVTVELPYPIAWPGALLRNQEY
jgi:hypothetical protein